MRRLLLVSVLCLTLCPHSSEGKRRKKKKDPDKELALKRLKQQKKAPGFMRWVESFEAGQLRVSHIDTTKAPALRLHLSILTAGDVGQLTPMQDWENVRTLEVMLAQGEEKRPKPWLSFNNLVPAEIPEDTPDDERPPAAEIVPMDKAELGLDVVVVAAGHGGFKVVEQLEATHKDGVKKLVNSFSDANMNVIWYGPMLYTYRDFDGISGELSRYDESLRLCEFERRKYRMLKAEFDSGDLEEEPELPPCGLHTGKTGDIKNGVERMRYRGMHSRLFAIDTTGAHSCTDDEVQSTALRFFDINELEERTSDSGAFEEAVRMMLRYGTPGNRKAIVVIGSGRDGYLHDERACRPVYTSKYCAKSGRGLRGIKRKRAVEACVQSMLDKRANLAQERFKPRAQKWLALLRTAGIRVFSVSYAMESADGEPISHAFERERLELLSVATGGTYREVYEPRKIDAAITATAQELMSERVVVIDADLASAGNYRVSVKARVIAGRGQDGQLRTSVLPSPVYAFTAPVLATGIKASFFQVRRAIVSHVGEVVFWVIVVLVALVLLFLLVMFFKVLKAGVAKVGKKLLGSGQKAATSVTGEK